MLIEPEDPTTPPDWPRSLRIIRKVTGVRVHEFLYAWTSRFWRPLLHEPRRQQHEHGHLQEFALPILKERFAWVPRRKVAGHAHACFAVLALCRVVLVQVGDHLCGQE